MGNFESVVLNETLPIPDLRCRAGLELLHAQQLALTYREIFQQI